MKQSVIYVGEERDDNDTDDDKMTTHWIDEKFTSILVEVQALAQSLVSQLSQLSQLSLHLWKGIKSIVWNYFGFPAQLGKFV